MKIDSEKLFKGYETVKEILITKGIMSKYSKSSFGFSHTEERIMNDLAKSKLISKESDWYKDYGTNSKKDISNFIIAIETEINNRKALVMGFCEYGLYDFCSKLSIDADKKWNVVELQEKLKSSNKKDEIISIYKKELELVGII